MFLLSRWQIVVCCSGSRSRYRLTWWLIATPDSYRPPSYAIDAISLAMWQNKEFDSLDQIIIVSIPKNRGSGDLKGVW